MMFAVGAYSGLRAVCGAVAQPAKNTMHVEAAIRRSWIALFGRLGFMDFGRVDLARLSFGHKFFMTRAANL
jgi:hypothetical protein